MDKIIVSIAGFLGIFFVWWFFFGKKDAASNAVATEGSIDIKVSGGYEPSTIVLKKGKKTILNLTRTDQNSCLEEIVIPDFKIKKFLPLNESVQIEITPQKEGKFNFSCGMNMYHGKIIVK